VPARWRREIVLDDAALQNELVAMTDHHTDALFAAACTEAGGVAFVNRVSRLVCDPERFESDELEEMSKKGMGAVYTLTSEGQPLRPPGYSAQSREAVLAELFRPYAKALEQQVDAQLERFGRCLLVDGHSFPSRPLPYEDASLERPDLCLGVDPFHTPPSLVDALERAAQRIGWQVAVNSPFAGSYVPTKHFGVDARVSSVMIEVNRRLYLDEGTGERLDRFSEARDVVANLVDKAILFEAFRNTTFVAFRPEGDLPIRIGARCAELDHMLETAATHDWAFITAFNPDGRAGSDSKNLAAQENLSRELSELAALVLPGEGRGDIGDWPPEPSLLGLGVSEAVAADLGRRYGQAAVVVGTRGAPARLLVL